MAKLNMFKNRYRLKNIKTDTEYYTSICPYCKATIMKEFKRKAINGGRWLQILHCNECGGSWTIIYNEDQTISRIIDRDVSLYTITKIGKNIYKSRGKNIYG